MRGGPSAESGDLFGDSQMRAQGTGEGSTDPILQFGSRQQPGGLGDTPFAVHSLGFDRVEPGALDRQQAGDEAHPAFPMDALVVIP